MATQKFTNFDNFFFFNARWYDSCHMQSNRIVLNEVKENYVLLEPSYRKKPNELFG